MMDYRCSERDVQTSMHDAFWQDIVDVIDVQIELERDELETHNATDIAKVAKSQGIIKALRLIKVIPESMILEMQQNAADTKELNDGNR